ncbi:hypothetical protein [Mycobacterium avium]|uniref:hypothetical protein n=1 Tax=Mycobacterium avium TaxID=1764 RepID=UPI001482863F|nr:hypothetical protein [Mycobacterium avium]
MEAVVVAVGAGGNNVSVLADGLVGVRVWVSGGSGPRPSGSTTTVVIGATDVLVVGVVGMVVGAIGVDARFLILVGVAVNVGVVDVDTSVRGTQV